MSRANLKAVRTDSNPSQDLDDVAEKVRRAHAIALLTQAAAGQPHDYSQATHDAMCVVSDMLEEALGGIEAVAERVTS